MASHIPFSGSLSTPHKSKTNSQTQFASNADVTKQKHVAQMVAWRESVRDAYSKAVPVEEFFSSYMAVQTAVSESDIQEIVKKSKNKLRKASKRADSAIVELTMYDPFVHYVNRVVTDFPSKRKPYFKNTSGVTFEHLHATDPDSRPDVASTLPGASRPLTWDWYHIGSIIEFKFKDDPFDAKQNHIIKRGQLDSLVQVLKNARCLMMATRSCYTFVVSVFGKRARLFRVDRSGYIVSHHFDWSEESSILPEFYWRLYRGGAEGYLLGHDTTSSKPTADEKRVMRSKLKKMKEYSSVDLVKATALSRWVQVQVDKKQTRAFTFGKPIFQSTGLFGRGTRVDCVLMDGKVYVTKDAWRQECRRPEHHFYDVIHDYVKRELKNEWPAGLAAWQGTLELWQNDPDHKTITAALRPKGGPLLDRCHDRSLFSSVGTALDNFESTMQLVKAIRAAIAGHEVAFKAGVLHRDISAGNVLLLSDGGFLLDFDYSAFTDEGTRRFEKLHPGVKTAEIEKALKDITGTFPFMSIASLLQVKNSALSFCHSPADDLQGFYWVLLWLILRHTDHAHPEGAQACADVFDGGVSEVIRKKKVWLYDYEDNAHARLPHLEIRENAPLTNLVTSLTKMLAEQLNHRSPPPTHTSFLAAFDEALASPGWPENDKSREFELPHIKDVLYPVANSDADAPMLHPQAPSGRIYPQWQFIGAQARAAASGSRGSTGSSAKRKRENDAEETEEEQGRVRRSARGAAEPATKSPRRSTRNKNKSSA